MKITLEKKDKDYLYIGIILLVISMSISYQVKVAGTYNAAIKEKEATNLKQKGDIGTLEISVIALNNETNKLLLEADSLQASERKYKSDYYGTNKKFKAAIATYASYSDDDKWIALTRAINE